MRRLPFFTPLALASALVTAAAIATAWWITGGEIASPGALGEAHAELAGGCGACHASPWSGARTSARCLDCHDDVAAELADGAGLHAHLGDVSGCLGCHTDHRGRDGELTRLDPTSFPHDATGFSLAAHRETRDGAAFACADCHPDGIARWDEARCEACHRDDEPAWMDAHLVAWGADCRGCHDGVDRFGPAFDHARTDFALAGEHVGVACERCHEGARTERGFGDAPDRCVGCHREDDVHDGRYGDDCARCHDAVGWKPARFDHATTAFPLTGAHTRVACADCHPGDGFQGAPTACVGCHPMPADHRGTFGDDCKACHDTTTWEGARFDHEFPLDHGARRPSPCETCHPRGYRTYTCYGCHEHTPAGIAREHREEGIADFDDCMRCHPTGREHEGDRGGDHGEGDDD